MFYVITRFLLVKMLEEIREIEVPQSRMRLRGSFWIRGEERVRD